MKQHTDALVALARTAPAFRLQTYVTVAKKVGAVEVGVPRLIVHPADGIDSQERLAGPDVTQHPRYVLHIVGSSYDQVAAGTKQLKDLFVVNGYGIEMAVPGEQSGKVWWDSPMPVQVDNDLIPPLLYQVVELGWSSDPA